MLTIGLIKEKRPGPRIVITCPICKSKDVWADTHEHVEIPTVLWVIPVGEIIKTVARCSACGYESISRYCLDELEDMSPAEVDASLKPRGSVAALVVGIASLILCPMPLINLIPALLTIFLNRRSTGIAKVLGYVPLLVTIAYNIWFIIMVVIEINKRMEEM